MSARESKIRLAKALAISWLALAVIVLPLTWVALSRQAAALTAELVKTRAEAAAKNIERIERAADMAKGRLARGGAFGARLERVKESLDERLVQEGFAYFSRVDAAGSRETNWLRAKGDDPLAQELKNLAGPLQELRHGAVQSFTASTGEQFVCVAYDMKHRGQSVRFEGIYAMPESVIEAQEKGMGMAIALMALSTLGLAALIWPVVTRLGRTVEAQSKSLLDANLELLDALGSSIASRDSDTHEHNYRVTLYSVWLAQRAGLAPEAIRGLIAGAFLHDVGKIGIPDAILLKPGKLDEEEFRIMKTHVEIGEKIIGKSKWLQPAKKVVGGHHEKWNGKGYPRGAKGAAIPVEARIFAIADVFDALTSKRPYKDPWPLEKALDTMRRDAGEHFDPKLFEAFEAKAGEWRARLEGLPLEKMEAILAKTVEKYWFYGGGPAVVRQTALRGPGSSQKSKTARNR